MHSVSIEVDDDPDQTRSTTLTINHSVSSDSISATRLGPEI